MEAYSTKCQTDIVWLDWKLMNWVLLHNLNIRWYCQESDSDPLTLTRFPHCHIYTSVIIWNTVLCDSLTDDPRITSTYMHLQWKPDSSTTHWRRLDLNTWVSILIYIGGIQVDIPLVAWLFPQTCFLKENHTLMYIHWSAWKCIHLPHTDQLLPW